MTKTLILGVVMASAAAAEAQLVPSCYGDCNANSVVEIDELIIAVALAGSGSVAGDDCAAYSGGVGIVDLIRSVKASLVGCPPLSAFEIRRDLRFPASPGLLTDLNGDGLADFASCGDDETVVLRGLGDGTFSDAFFFDQSCTSIDAADVDGDGVLDLVSTSGGIEIRLGEGGGIFAGSSARLDGDRPKDLAVGDFNADGVTDFVVANDLFVDIAVFLSEGLATDGELPAFREVVLVGDGTPVRVETADLDSDGSLDVLVGVRREETSTLEVLWGNGDGTFAPRQPISEGGPGAAPIFSVADLGGDGRPEIVLLEVASTEIAVFSSDSARAFTARRVPTVGEPFALLVADFDRDEELDVLVSSSSRDGLSLHRGSAGGTLLDPLPVGSDASRAKNLFPHLVGDIDGDGATDLIGLGDGALFTVFGQPPP